MDVAARRRVRRAQPHEGGGGGPACEHLGVVAVLVQKLRCLVHRRGAGVFECGGDHLRASFPSWDAPRESCICFPTRAWLPGMSACFIPTGDSAPQMTCMTPSLPAAGPPAPLS